MSRRHIRYFVARHGRHGPRHFWQPSEALRAAGWQLLRLSDDPAVAIGEAEARNAELDAWRAGGAELADVARHVRPGTVAALVAKYKGTRHYRHRRPSTRASYDRNLRWIEDWCGDVPVRALTSQAIQAWYEANFAGVVDKRGRTVRPARPAKANGMLRVLRLLLAYAKLDGQVTVNVAEKPKMEATGKKGRIWSPAMVEAFIAAADATGRHSLGTAVLLNEWLGQRPSDLVPMPWAAMKAGVIGFIQSKTGSAVELPVDLVPRLTARIEAERIRQRERGVICPAILCSETQNGPYSLDAFSRAFAELRDQAAAGLPEHGLLPCPELAGIWFEHLRHTAIVRLAEAGCTVLEIAAITGHSLATAAQIIDRYLSRTAKLGRAAFAKRIAAEERIG